MCFVREIVLTSFRCQIAALFYGTRHLERGENGGVSKKTSIMHTFGPPPPPLSISCFILFFN